jgi:hypothetical protein
VRTPTTPRPASASASAMTPTVRLSLNYCRLVPVTGHTLEPKHNLTDSKVAPAQFRRLPQGDGLPPARDETKLLNS